MLLLVAPVEGVLGLASEHVHLGAKYQTLPMGSFLGEKSSFIKKGKNEGCQHSRKKVGSWIPVDFRAKLGKLRQVQESWRRLGELRQIRKIKTD